LVQIIFLLLFLLFLLLLLLLTHTLISTNLGRFSYFPLDIL
jgi:hypothetical protein